MVSIQYFICYKQLIKNITVKSALDFLNKNQGSKCRKYENLEMAPFLCANDIVTPEIAKFIAKLQCYMVEGIKYNFKGKYKEQNLQCNICKIRECTQEHLLECPILLGANESLTYIPNYNDLFENNIEEQAYIAKIMKENLNKKKKLQENAF